MFGGVFMIDVVGSSQALVEVRKDVVGFPAYSFEVTGLSSTSVYNIETGGGMGKHPYLSKPTRSVCIRTGEGDIKALKDKSALLD